MKKRKGNSTLKETQGKKKTKKTPECTGQRERTFKSGINHKKVRGRKWGKLKTREKKKE